MIITNVEGLRDPFILLDNGVYYLYGTGNTENGWENTVWDCYINDSGKLDGQWKRTEKPIYEKPEKALKKFWAPEVHKYKGAYYMLCTYFSSETQRKGSTILKSSSPTGPFVEISDGYVTPRGWDCIDATLYVDGEGQPWLVFVREWVCTEDNVGRMAAAKLSDDLSRLISEPIELFRADSPSWSNQVVTDGCFMYTTQSKELLMLWSNFTDDEKYVIGIAKSDNGKIDGSWIHQDELLFSEDKGDGYDGGHGMIFTAIEGQKYLCLHSPNKHCDKFRERTVFLPVEELNGTVKII